MKVFARLFRLIWGADVDRALRPVLAVNFASSMGGSTVWSFVGLWAIRLCTRASRPSASPS